MGGSRFKSQNLDSLRDSPLSKFGEFLLTCCFLSDWNPFDHALCIHINSFCE